MGEFARLREDAIFEFTREILGPAIGQEAALALAESGQLLASPKAHNYYRYLDRGFIKYEPGIGFTAGTISLESAFRQMPDLPEVLHLPAGDEWSALARQLRRAGTIENQDFDASAVLDLAA